MKLNRPNLPIEQDDMCFHAETKIGHNDMMDHTRADNPSSETNGEQQEKSHSSKCFGRNEAVMIYWRFTQLCIRSSVSVLLPAMAEAVLNTSRGAENEDYP